MIRALGAFGLGVARLTGALALVLARTTLNLPRLDRRELFRSIVLFGYRSLPLALMAATLIGSTVVLQAGVYAVKFGARLYTGWAAGYALTREFGPLLLGLVMAARIGARNAAELALLNVNGQIEGLRGISLDPFRILVAPRVVGSAIAITCLGSVTFLVAVCFEAVSSYFSLGLPLRVFFDSYQDMLRVGDLVGGLTKTLAFGLAIALVSTVAGLRAKGGAVGVGQAAASAVVLSCAAIFSLDLLLTPFLTRLFG
ncbi:MAG: ABC transporter permease [Archangiaceae bacterium]|nr:ABC transporter permease [Archangiaceae bacterium]